MAAFNDHSLTPVVDDDDHESYLDTNDNPFLAYNFKNDEMIKRSKLPTNSN